MPATHAFDAEIKIDEFLTQMFMFLKTKNRRYGNSALEPMTVFSIHLGDPDPAVNNILVRLDDKVSRIRNSDELRKNDIIDLIGYLVLLSVAKGWDDLGDLID